MPFRVVSWMNSQNKELTEQKQNNETRRAMLAAIRAHLSASAPFDAVHEEHQARHGVRPQESRAPALLHDTASALTQRFQEALEAVAGHCVVVRDEVDAAQVVSGIIGQLQARRVAVSNAPLVERVVARVKPEAEWLEQAS